MPTLTRLIMTLLVLAGLAYGAMIALVVSVEPTPRTIIVPVPLEEALETRSE